MRGIVVFVCINFRYFGIDVGRRVTAVVPHIMICISNPLHGRGFFSLTAVSHSRSTISNPFSKATASGKENFVFFNQFCFTSMA